LRSVLREFILPQQYRELIGAIGDGPRTLEDISSRLGLDSSSLMRTLAELESIGFLKIERKIMRVIELTQEGNKYLVRGLPEVRLLRILKLCKCNPRIDEVHSLAKAYGIELDPDELKYATGVLARLRIIRIKDNVIELIEPGADLEERQRMLNQVSLMSEDLLSEFARRGIVRIKEKVQVVVSLTEEAKEALNRGLVKFVPMVTSLNRDLIVTGSWRQMFLKPFDLSIEPPEAPVSLKHFLTEFLDHVREVFVAMGFEEVKGPHVELEFWNFDALFQAQDHPAREIHDTYFLKREAHEVSIDAELLSRVGKTHEDGWITGSKGWGYVWDPRRASRLILRTQTTAVTARAIHARGDGEYRIFTVDRVFRPEVLDPKHSMEFHQADGAVVGPNLGFKHLLGILEQLAKGLGLGKVLFKPAYFPFTSPSAEGYAKHEVLGWVEFVGSGVLRPEVTIPLGLRNSRVLAFGMGLDRIAMILMGIDDIRELFTHNLSSIRRHWSNYASMMLATSLRESFYY